ncbi:glycosyltransferase [Vibrio splendidus]|jgi:glycosyltransferase involved in cell wall biosynthesis
MSDKYVFNCSTNIIGGAVQNSVNFILQIHEHNELHKWFFILSYEVFEQVSSVVNSENSLVISSPAKSFVSRIKIKKIVKKLSPRFVYTSAGPAYVNFDAFHIMGCSNPYILGASKQAYDLTTNKFTYFIRILHNKYQRYYIKKADHWFLQTEKSRQQMTLNGVSIDDCSIVYNAVAPSFLDCNPNFKKLHLNSIVRVLVPSAYYPHKNLKILIELLKKEGVSSRLHFSLTISEDSYKSFSLQPGFDEVSNNISNIGSFSHKDAASIYAKFDVVFLPSVLEVFSTSYIEAIAMKMPLIVPDLPFSKSICGDYALYYKSDSIDDCLNAFSEIFVYQKNIDRYEEFREKIIEKFSNQEDRYKKILDKVLSLTGGV